MWAGFEIVYNVVIHVEFDLHREIQTANDLTFSADKDNGC